MVGAPSRVVTFFVLAAVAFALSLGGNLPTAARVPQKGGRSAPILPETGGVTLASLAAKRADRSDNKVARRPRIAEIS